MKKTVLIIALMLLSCSALLSQINDLEIETNWQKDIVIAAKKELAKSGTPSLQIAIAMKDSLIFEGAVGMADIENDVTATIESKYRTASVSKWWTATAAMILVNRGVLDLDLPIQAYCPYFPEKEWPITTRQLITHTSGIRHYIDYEAELLKAKDAIDSAEVERLRCRDMLGTFTRYTEMITPLRNFKNDSLLFKPGTDWAYSSNGYRLLGCILEGASGKPYRKVMEELIFRPAKMKNTVEDDAWAIIPRRVSGYRIIERDSLRRAEIRDVSENLPAGGYLSTASDLVRFSQAFHNRKFFSAEIIDLMSAPYNNKSGAVTFAPSWRDAIPSKERYGYGVMLFPDLDFRKVGHTGRQAGGSAIVVLIPEKELSIAIMTNAKGWDDYIEFTKTIENIIANAP